MYPIRKKVIPLSTVILDLASFQKTLVPPSWALQNLARSKMAAASGGGGLVTQLSLGSAASRLKAGPSLEWTDSS